MDTIELEDIEARIEALERAAAVSRKP